MRKYEGANFRDVIDAYERKEKEDLAKIQHMKKLIEECQEIIHNLWPGDKK